MKSYLVSRKAALLALDWCKNRYGSSQFNKIETLTLKLNSNLRYEDPPHELIVASYDPSDNEISINPKLIRSLLDLCDTVIHEYTHFQQDIDIMYHKYTEEYGRNYTNHPYEASANARGTRDKAECKRSIIKLLRKSKKRQKVV